ncbi:hypothetical protein IKF28_00365 [Candidatus Saccharibacteria bacterium]|nr:hypothetical protein [Candidatus Saccharibacteria bacterium]MBR3121884.1 hypothetical protein [Candidatus Saccharibacteria bacterium]
MNDSLNSLMNQMTNQMNTSMSNSTGAMQGILIWTIVATVLAILGSIFIYFMFIKSKSDFKGGLKTLHDYLSGDIIHIESLAKMFYYTALIYVVLTSINSLIEIGITGSNVGMCIVSFFFQLLLGPVVVRFIFEIVMMFIRIWKNTDTMAKKK